ncbi:methyl-accepting chemotaxis protein [Pseudoalteromonas sp. SSMSWG5]|uniref:methyl-accepting chemotaxis protein n=1 Tax=Pseudoalteromonas sp. SSMSWG5 TaxID=3139396 RepID=UPI003BABC947
MLKDLVVGKKIWGSFLLVFTIFVITSLMINHSLSKLNHDVKTITKSTLPSINLLKSIQVVLTDIRKDEFSLISNSENPKLIDWLNELEQKRLNVETVILKYEALQLSPEELQTFAHFKKAWKQYKQETEPYNQYLSSGDIKKANSVVLSSLEAYTRAIESLNKAVNANSDRTITVDETINERLSITRWVVIVSAILVITVIVLSSMWLTHSVRQPVQHALELASSIASGHLNNILDEESLSQDELGNLLLQISKMQNNLNSLVTKVNSAIIQLSSSVEEMSAISTQTASGMQNQQAELSSVASAMTEMQAAVAEVAQNTEVAASSASESSNMAKQGNLSIEKMIAVISKVSNSIDESKQLASELEISSKDINMVVDVIGGIAEQTNLLALNAAIEAARAGEQGRGFAVVADEVRSLARRTQASTQQIVDIVEQLQKKSKLMGESSDLCSDEISECVKQAQHAGSQIVEIEHSVEQIANMSIQIATACSEQNAVTEDLNRSIEQINAESTEMSEGASQTAIACGEISQLAYSLKEQLEKFKL